MSLFHGESRTQMRRRYLEAWRKFSAREPLEAQVAALITDHPEYDWPVPSLSRPLSLQPSPGSGAEFPRYDPGVRVRKGVSSLVCPAISGLQRPAAVAGRETS
jgi:hypothetical protein